MSVRYEKRVQDLEAEVAKLKAAVAELQGRFNCCLGQHAEDCASYTGPSRAELDNLQDENETLRVNETLRAMITRLKGRDGE